MISLYQMASELDFFERMASEGHEVTPEEINNLTELIKTKIGSCVDYSRYLNDRATAIESRISDLKELLDHEERKIERMNNYYKSCLERLGVTSLIGIDSSIKIMKNPPSLNVVDETLVPEKYISHKIIETKSLDKKSILDALKGGESVLGCELQQKTRIVIK